MQKITMADYRGGIQEASGPNDFTERQWAQLKGFIPESDAVFESQWAGQQIGSDGGFQFVIPIPSAAGTFLVAVKAAGQADEGTIWWAKAPDPSASYTTANAVTWTQIVEARNRGYTASSDSAFTQPTIPIVPNPNFRFITYLPFEAHKFIKTPSLDQANQFSKDVTLSTTPKSILSGALFHSRRVRSATGYGEDFAQQAVVVYVDPDALGAEGQVFAATFPNWRRLRQKEDGTFFNVTDLSGAKTFTNSYPFGTGIATSPSNINNHFPYASVLENGANSPGRGVIPRGNVGTMLGNLLVLGDIEWSSDEARRPDAGDPTTEPPTPSALYPDGTHLFALNDSNTAPHRSSFYMSLGDIDEFDPLGILRAGGTDAAILGMHELGDNLIIITSAGSESDGVIVYRGDISEVVNYSREPNFFAFEREVLKGGVGGFPRDDRVVGHRAFSALWGEGNVVVFVDRLGGVWWTNGKDVDRLDRYGPLPPQSGSVDDHVASVGKHLFVWRDSRLLVFSTLESYDGEAAGCWTEIIPPSTNIKSMYGLNEELYMISNGQVWRFSRAAPRSERGHLNGTPVDLVVSTRTIGSPDEQSRKHWHRLGVTVESIGGAEIVSLTTRNTSSRAASASTASYTVSLGQQVTNGEGRAMAPAGIGSQTLVSATAVFRGDVRLQEFSLWFTGGVPTR